MWCVHFKWVREACDRSARGAVRRDSCCSSFSSFHPQGSGKALSSSFSHRSVFLHCLDCTPDISSFFLNNPSWSKCTSKWWYSADRVRLFKMVRSTSSTAFQPQNQIHFRNKHVHLSTCSKQHILFKSYRPSARSWCRKLLWGSWSRCWCRRRRPQRWRWSCSKRRSSLPRGPDGVWRATWGK